MLDGPGSSRTPQTHADAERGVAAAHDRLTAAETRLDQAEGKLAEQGPVQPDDEHEQDPVESPDALRDADGLLGRPKIVIGTDDESNHTRQAQQQVRELVAEQIRQNRPAEAKELATTLGPDLFTHEGLPGGAHTDGNGPSTGTGNTTEDSITGNLTSPHLHQTGAPQGQPSPLLEPEGRARGLRGQTRVRRERRRP